MNNLTTYIDNFEKEILTSDVFFDFKSFDNNYKLACLYSYYHYFNADPSSLDELFDGIVYQDNSQDHIACLFIDQESDLNDVDAVISCCVENDIDFPGIIKLFKDAESELKDIKDKKTSERDKLSKILNEDEYKYSSIKPLKIVLITNYTPQTLAKRKMIINAINTLKPDDSFVSYQIRFGSDVEYEILEIESPKDNVSMSSIEIDSSENLIKYGKEESIVANVSARSLKDLYELYGYRGLFAQNLRYYVKNSKVDDNIINTIENHPDNFWYFNNGIIIVCDNYDISENKINLTNFSIVNGGQTTKLIGESEINKDFSILCKIVKNRYEKEEDKLDFIASVAEASNTQKPIKGKDLIANRVEQRQLKKQLSEVGIYCQIKRGEKVNKKIYPEAWQNTTNEEIGQFLLSFMYQQPGSARSNKASICENEERYRLLFSKKYNSELIKCLLKIKAYYKKWMAYCKKYDDGTDPYRYGLVNNGMLFTTAIIGAICKMYYHPEYIAVINETVSNEQKMQVISQYDLSHPCFKETMIQKDFFDLFEYCYTKFLRTGYEFLKSFKPNYSNYSNFTKTNNYYSLYVFKQICYEFKNGIGEEDLEFLNRILYKASSIDLKNNDDLLEKYVNLISDTLNRTPIASEEVIEKIKDELIKYRTKTYKIKRMKAYEVFKNKSAEIISKYAPTSIESLKELKCLDEAQFDMFGKDIVDIVNSCIK